MIFRTDAPKLANLIRNTATRAHKDNHTLIIKAHYPNQQPTITIRQTPNPHNKHHWTPLTSPDTRPGAYRLAALLLESLPEMNVQLEGHTMTLQGRFTQQQIDTPHGKKNGWSEHTNKRLQTTNPKPNSQTGSHPHKLR